MTIDDERWRNIQFAEKFLRALGGQEIPEYDMKGMRVSSQVRQWACSLLKHYPEPWWIDQQRKKP